MWCDRDSIGSAASVVPQYSCAAVLHSKCISRTCFIDGWTLCILRLLDVCLAPQWVQPAENLVFSSRNACTRVIYLSVLLVCISL